MLPHLAVDERGGERHGVARALRHVRDREIRIVVDAVDQQHADRVVEQERHQDEAAEHGKRAAGEAAAEAPEPALARPVLEQEIVFAHGWP